MKGRSPIFPGKNFLMGQTKILDFHFDEQQQHPYQRWIANVMVGYFSHSCLVCKNKNHSKSGVQYTILIYNYYNYH
ncbi:MAG: hypothetical protein CMIDDMOC_00479 [Sodalis sp. Fle]|nr:MAG: hypothetical protein CMIDDMOC_00479 [Sodalis sp. Fle]